MSEVNKAVIRRVIEEGMNKHNLAVFNELCPSVVYHSPATGQLRGGAFRDFVNSFLTAFPDARAAVLDQFAEGDRVATRWSFTGTHNGLFLGNTPTGRSVKITCMWMDRIVKGKIVEQWAEWDTLGMMRQLGLVPEVKAHEVVKV